MRFQEVPRLWGGCSQFQGGAAGRVAAGGWLWRVAPALCAPGSLGAGDAARPLRTPPRERLNTFLQRTVGQRRAGAQTLPFSAYPAELSSPHFLELYVFLYFTGEELNWGLDKFAAFFSPLKDHTVKMEKKSRARGYVT